MILQFALGAGTDLRVDRNPLPKAEQKREAEASLFSEYLPLDTFSVSRKTLEVTGSFGY